MGDNTDSLARIVACKPVVVGDSPPCKGVQYNPAVVEQDGGPPMLAAEWKLVQKGLVGLVFLPQVPGQEEEAAKKKRTGFIVSKKITPVQAFEEASTPESQELTQRMALPRLP